MTASNPVPEYMRTPANSWMAQPVVIIAPAAENHIDIWKRVLVIIHVAP